MTPRRLQLGLAAFTMLSGTVLFNILYLQGSGSQHGRIELGPSPETMRPPVALPAGADTTAAETVQAVQRELQAHGYALGRPDGVVSLVTRAAVLAYEIDHGLPLTADPSAGVLQAIVLGSADDGAATQSSARPGPQAEQVIRTIQQSLTAVGLGPVKVDGHLGEETVRAISRFEREQGLPPTGRISGMIVARLAQRAADIGARKQK